MTHAVPLDADVGIDDETGRNVPASVLPASLLPIVSATAERRGSMDAWPDIRACDRMPAAAAVLAAEAGRVDEYGAGGGAACS